MKKNGKTRNYMWYLEVDAFTNEAIAALLASKGEAAESEVVSFFDDKGKPHSGWRVRHSLIEKLKKDQKSFPFKFKVFVQEGAGKPRLWTFGGKKKISAETKRALKDLKNIQQRQNQK